MEPCLSDMTELLKTPLNDLHLSLGARMVPFAGYSMPVQYPEGLMAEHLHTRVKVLCHQAFRVLHGHAVTRKRDHASTQRQVQIVQWGFE